MISRGLYMPEEAKISSVRRESKQVKTFRLKIRKTFMPGQFFQVSLLGVGEAPISISSSPAEKGFIELTVRNTGSVTGAIHGLKKGDSIGLRGPFGNFFPIEDALNKDLIFAAGGIGLAPLRSLIRYVIDNRKRYGRVYLLYGARTRDEMIFKEDLKNWSRTHGFNVLLTVDSSTKGWKGNVGVVTRLFDDICIEPHNTSGFVCGPPVMIRYAIHRLIRLGLDDSDILVTLERYMKCGVGKCGHCYISDRYICTDGPVFSLKGLKGMKPEGIIA